MKLLILIFILYVHYCTAQYPDDSKKPVTQYPKKVRPGLTQYNNAGFYIKSLTTTKKPSSKLGEYTAFAKPSLTAKGQYQLIPDSPYFPIEEPKQPEGRRRIKKVLPELELPSHRRQKRSANGRDEITLASSQKLSSASKTKHVNAVAKKASSVKRSVAQSDRLKSAKHVGHAKPAAKKSAVRLSGRIGSKSKRGSKNQKLRAPKSARLGKKPSRARESRSKKHKSSKKRPSNSVRKLKGSRPRKAASKLRDSNGKKIAKSPRNHTSRLRGSANPKGFRSRRLIAARDALIEEYPYTISIQKDGHHWCSGALLNPRLIITTANCLWRSNTVSRLHVRAGSRHTDRGGQLAGIQEVMKHPGWKVRKNPDNDVALALLNKDIRFSHGVHGVDLPNRMMLPPFDDAWITSWGSERRDGIYDSRSVSLQVYHARLMDRDKCNNITQRFGVSVTENFICLAQTGKRAPCTRDTGAPAVSDGVLWGLASWGIRKLCGTERFPAVFSYIASQSNINFIVNATHYLMAEERTYPFLDYYPVKRVSVTTPAPSTPQPPMSD